MQSYAIRDNLVKGGHENCTYFIYNDVGIYNNALSRALQRKKNNNKEHNCVS